MSNITKKGHIGTETLLSKSMW